MSAIIDMIEIVASRLGKMREEVVFAGGATTILFVTDPAVVDIRPTKDIDVIIEVATFAKYAKLEDRLRAKGFVNLAGPKAPICRWRTGDVLLDVMPTLPDILGFSNRWYQAAVSESDQRILPSGKTIRIVRPEHFIATKIEAFLGRGNDDFVMSHDIEDVITVIDGRPELKREVDAARNDVRSFIRTKLGIFAAEDDFRNAILGYLPPDSVGQSRFGTIMERVRELVSQET